jgi:hypothetical protein
MKRALAVGGGLLALALGGGLAAAAISPSVGDNGTVSPGQTLTFDVSDTYVGVGSPPSPSCDPNNLQQPAGRIDIGEIGVPQGHGAPLASSCTVFGDGTWTFTGSITFTVPADATGTIVVALTVEDWLVSNTYSQSYTYTVASSSTTSTNTATTTTSTGTTATGTVPATTTIVQTVTQPAATTTETVTTAVSSVEQSLQDQINALAAQVKALTDRVTRLEKAGDASWLAFQQAIENGSPVWYAAVIARGTYLNALYGLGTFAVA